MGRAERFAGGCWPRWVKVSGCAWWRARCYVVKEDKVSRFGVQRKRQASTQVKVKVRRRCR